jgi:hypothetical protein
MLPLRTAWAYFIPSYRAGFLLGAFRVFALEPAMGPVAAVVAETPFLVAFYWFAWAAVLRRSCSGFKPAARLAISISWLALLIAAEIGLGMLLRGFSLE